MEKEKHGAEVSMFKADGNIYAKTDTNQYFVQVIDSTNIDGYWILVYANSKEITRIAGKTVSFITWA